MKFISSDALKKKMNYKNQKEVSTIPSNNALPAEKQITTTNQ